MRMMSRDLRTLIPSVVALLLVMLPVRFASS